MDKLYIIDTMYYIFRSFYSLPQNLTNSEGLHTGAVLGVYNMLRNAFCEQKIKNCAAVFESRTPTFRSELDAAYKANRPQAPQPLKEQIPLVQEMLEVLGIRCESVSGYEADDVMASIAVKMSDAGEEAFIFTADKDLAQVLVHQGVSIVHTPKKAGESFEFITAANVAEKYGVSAAKIPDWLALMGDSSDNNQGLPGIGAKTAAKILAKHSVPELLENPAAAADVNKKYPGIIAANVELLRHNLEMTTIRCNVEVPDCQRAADFSLRPLDIDRARAFFARLGMKKALSDFDCLFMPGDTIAEIWS